MPYSSFFDGVKIHVLKRVCFMQNAENQWNIIQSGGLVFMWKLSPPISPPVRCGILLQFAVWIKRKTADNDWLSAVFIVLLFVWVIRLGLEPRTPTLKVLCSTCWASESILYYCYSSELRVQRYSLFLYLQTFLELFSKKNAFYPLFIHCN